MNRFILASVIGVLTVVSLQAGELQKVGTGARILASDFPKTAARAMFFEERINSRDSSVRARVLIEVGYFYSLPDSEYVGFLKRMYQDPSELVRGMAVKRLYDMWVSQEPESLPPTFIGYTSTSFPPSNEAIDRTSETTVGELIEQCSEGGPTGGYAAYALGILRAKEAIPALKKLGTDDNIFARYTAARALLTCGDRSSAIAILDEISSMQFSINTSDNVDTEKPIRRHGESPWYVACACRALIEVGGKEKHKGLERLIELMRFLEESTDANDQISLHWVRGMLAVASGKFFTNSGEATAWMMQNESRTSQKK
jgi:hypothetical protein